MASTQSPFPIARSHRGLGAAVVLLLAVICVAQTPNATPAQATGVIRLRVRVKVGESTRGLSRKRFFLIKGTREQNKSLIDAIEQRTLTSRDCYYRQLGASEALIKWLNESDCESVYCREIQPEDIDGAGAVPEFKVAVAAGEKEFVSRDLARKWATVNLPANVRDGFYKQRQEELRVLLKQAEELSQAPVLSVMTDTKGTAYFTELLPGTYVVSNLVPGETGNRSISWNCEVQVKPGDLATEKPYLISNVQEKNVKCVGVEKPLPVCGPAANGGQ
ncbi:MAG: prealbumin-like fold domain-containing protein [Pyrinomonadaceae bacterium]|nr:prealbumin-like fold domain-containing protein [Pyrinomonadaceae bacterium]